MCIRVFDGSKDELYSILYGSNHDPKDHFKTTLNPIVVNGALMRVPSIGIAIKASEIKLFRIYIYTSNLYMHIIYLNVNCIIIVKVKMDV